MRGYRRMGVVIVALAALVVPSAARGLARPASTTAVPKRFRSTSITWISPTTGWVLGGAPCGQRQCAYVIGTNNGGDTWQRIGRVPSPIAHIGKRNKPGVTEIRFATAQIGFAFAPRLLHTTDGGRTWTRMPVPGNGRQVFDLATNGKSAFALVSPCRWERFGPCPGQLSLWRTDALAGTSWTKVPMRLPHSTRGDVSASGSAVYVVDPQVDVNGEPDKFYASTDGGRHFAPRPVPCDKPNTPDVPLVQAVATSRTKVALLCVGDPGFSKAQKFVYTSTTTARHDQFRGRMGWYGIQSQLAVSPSGNLAVASQSDGSFIYVNNTKGGRTWSRVWATGDGGAGWNDITYVNNRVAWVIRGPLAGPSFSERGKLYVTHNAGRTWYIHPITSAV